ncbi:hypothetical protein GCM10007338_00010 [Corynebacterium pelargi]|nr:hypothetical protein GCM10007338_00010 [Corynebacterium pelargi]
MERGVEIEGENLIPTPRSFCISDIEKRTRKPWHPKTAATITIALRADAIPAQEARSDVLNSLIAKTNTVVSAVGIKRIAEVDNAGDVEKLKMGIGQSANMPSAAVAIGSPSALNVRVSAKSA